MRVDEGNLLRECVEIIRRGQTQGLMRQEIVLEKGESEGEPTKAR